MYTQIVTLALFLWLFILAATTDSQNVTVLVLVAVLLASLSCVSYTAIIVYLSHIMLSIIDSSLDTTYALLC